MDEIGPDVRENEDEAHPDNVAWVDTQNNHLAEIGEQGRETMDDIRRNVRENDPDNVAWVNAQNNLFATGHETAHEIRRDVQENGDEAHPDNVAWVDAQNNRLHQIASMAAGWVGCNDVVVPGFLA